MALVLHEYQRVGIRQAALSLASVGGYLLEWDPGMGKTLAGVLLARLMHRRRIVVICPVVALGVWMYHIKTYDAEAGGALFHNMWNQTWGDPRERAYFVTTYGHIRSKRNGAFLLAKRHQPDLVILDESHNVKSPSSKQRLMVQKLVDGPNGHEQPRRLLLSGSPADDPLDWWTQFRMIAPHDPMWAQTYTLYKEWIGIPHKTLPHVIAGFRPECVDQAKRAMEHYHHVASASELKVPDPIYSPVIVPFGSDGERRTYRQMERDSYTKLDDGEEADASTILVKQVRLHQLTGGNVRSVAGAMERTGETKLKALLALLDERREKNVIIASMFLAEIEQIGNALGYREGALHGKTKPKGHVVLQITGATPPEERSRIEQVFQTAPFPTVLLLQYKAGGQALTLTNADALILYSMSPSGIDYKQMVGRVWRHGQTKAVQVLPLMIQETVDEDLWLGLQGKLDLVDMAAFIRQKALARIA